MAKILNIYHVYPRLCRWVEANLPEIERKRPRVFNAFVKHSGLSRAKASLALKNGYGPEIMVAKIYPHNGLYQYEKAENTVMLSENIARRFENLDFNDTRMHMLLESTIIHEMTHWGDLKADGKQQLDAKGRLVEEGIKFEVEAYGRDLDPYWPGQYLGLTEYELNKQQSRKRR